MFESTDDLRIAHLKPLIPPAILMEELPVTEKASITVSSGRGAVNAALSGTDDRLVVVAGPCSIHDSEAAHEYGNRLQKAAEGHAADLIVIMRVYFEKPRTTVGWKGLINDPHLDDSFDINNGLRAARGLLVQLADMGLPTGSEFLDTITPQFIADLISWGAIGARTTESQVHRELASGLSMPVGFKNGTNGNVQIAIDAIGAAGFFRLAQPKRFGGLECDLPTIIRCLMQWSPADASTAWVAGLAIMHQWIIALFPPEAQQDIWSENPDAITMSRSTELRSSRTLPRHS